MQSRIRTMSVALALFCLAVGSAAADPALSYTNWPATPHSEWVALTNHITWCYRSLVDRVQAAGNPDITTNDITPSYIWPAYDYQRFAQKIDSVASSYADQTKANGEGGGTDYEKWFLTPMTNGSYPTDFPCWTATNLHQQAFGSTNWSTNLVLSGWMCATNHPIQKEVQKSLLKLVWTVKTSSQTVDPKYRYMQIDATHGDVWPTGVDTNTDRRSFSVCFKDLKQNWNNLGYCEGANYGAPIYSASALALNDLSSSVVLYSTRHYAKPSLKGVCTNYVCDPSWYLYVRQTGFGNESWYTKRYFTRDMENAGYRGLQTNHVICSKQSLSLSRQESITGDYIFFGNCNSSPITQSAIASWNDWAGGKSKATRYVEYVYCQESLWLLKWDQPGGFNLEEPTLPPETRCENTDTDRDDIVDPGVDMNSLGADSGTIAFRPECDEPQVVLPVASMPAWYAGLPVHAYLSQGGFTNLPFQYLAHPNVDQDGYYSAYSLNTRIEESGVLSNKTDHLKRVSLVRPRGNVVIFDFKWDKSKSKFATQGYPIGVNKSRSYVLFDTTPDNDKDKQYDLCFTSGVIHRYGADGKLTTVAHTDGSSVSIPDGMSWCSIDPVSADDDDGPVSAWDQRYDTVDITWNNGLISNVVYASAINPAEENTVTLTRDPARFISGLDKTLLPETKAALSADRRTITYGTAPMTLSRSATAGTGRPRTVTLTRYIPEIGTAVTTIKLDAADKPLQVDVSAAGAAAVTKYTYADGTDRYDSGLLKNSRLKSVTTPDGATVNYEYASDTGWLSKETLSGVNRTVEYSYDNALSSGTAANPTNFVERPRRIDSKYGSSLIGRTLYAYTNGSTIIKTSADSAISDWADTNNLATTQNFSTSGNTAGMLTSVTHPQGTVTYANSEGSDGLTVTATHSSGDTVITTMTAFGAVVHSETQKDGHTVAYARSPASSDAFGRITQTVHLDGTTDQFKDYSFSGPATVTGVDGSDTTVDYFKNGLVKKVTDSSVGITTTYTYDPLGNRTGTTRSGGGRSVSTSASYDSLGRLTSFRDERGATTSHSWSPTATGVRHTVTPPTGGSYAEELRFDGAPASISGSAASQQLSYQYGVENGQFYQKTINADKSVEYLTTYHNQISRPVREKWSGAAGAETTISYDSKARPISARDEEGYRSVQTYNAQNRVEHSGLDVDHDGTPDLSGSDRLQTFEQNTTGAGINNEVFGYRTSGNSTPTLLSSSQASLDGRTVTDTVADRTTTTTRSGYTAPGVYTVTRQSSDGSSEVLQYRNWRLESVTARDAGSAQKTKEAYEYDGLGELERVKSTRGGIDHVTFYTRDSLGRVIRVDTPKGTLTYYYSGNTDRITSVHNPDGTVMHYEYDDAGRVTHEYDQSTHNLRYEYDSQGRLTKLIQRKANQDVITSWDYDPARGLPTQKKINGLTANTYNWRNNGQLASVADANGVTASMNYNAGSADLENIVFSDGVTRSIVQSFDRMGIQTGIGQLGGINQSQARTIDGRLLSETIAGAGIVADAALTYGYVPNQTAIASVRSAIPGGGADTLTVGYDAWPRVTGLFAGAVSATYGYAGGVSAVNAMNITCAGATLDKTVGWDFATMRPTSIVYRITGSSVTSAYALAYAPFTDRLAKVTREDGSIWNYTYDALGQLLSAGKHAADGSEYAGLQFGYAYDALGNTLQAGPLNNARQPRYSFDASSFNVHVKRHWGNAIEITGTARTNATITVNGVLTDRNGAWFRAVVPVANGSGTVNTQMTVTAIWRDPDQNRDVKAETTGRISVPMADEALQYDLKQSLLADSRRTFRFDAHSRLIQAVNNALTLPVKELYEYYADGRRARKQVYHYRGDAWKLARTHQYYYDRWNLISEIINYQSSIIVNSYVWGLDLAGQRNGSYAQDAGGIGGLLAMSVTQNGVTSNYFPICDANGTIHRLISAQTKQVVAEYEYSPYGVLIGATGPAKDACPFRFSSKYYDADTELYYYGYRYYDPASTKWLTRDPLEEQGGLNLTAFCGNDPVNKTDALGLFAQDFHYYVIYYLMRAKGWGDVEASAIADYSQYVDNDPYTDPIANTLAGRPEVVAGFHFYNSMQNRVTITNDVDAYKRAFEAGHIKGSSFTISSAEAMRFGVRLHTYADTFAHAGFSGYVSKLNYRQGGFPKWVPAFGHLDAFHDPDLISLDDKHMSMTLEAVEAIYDLIPDGPGLKQSKETIRSELSKSLSFQGVEGRRGVMRNMLGVVDWEGHLAQSAGQMKTLISARFGECWTDYNEKEIVTKHRAAFLDAIGIRQVIEETWRVIPNPSGRGVTRKKVRQVVPKYSDL